METYQGIVSADPTELIRNIALGSSGRALGPGSRCIVVDADAIDMRCDRKSVAATGMICAARHNLLRRPVVAL